MEEGITRWIAAHPEHPYARTGWEGIAEALAAFRELFPPPYSFVAAGIGQQPPPHRRGDDAPHLSPPRHDAPPAPR